MKTLTTEQAIGFVRKSIDEIGMNESEMMGASGDALHLDDMIRKHIPDAVFHVHASAPIELLDGKSLNVGADMEVSLAANDNSVLALQIQTPIVRIVSLKLKDSDISVVSELSESSAEGRKQSNRHIRGTFDRPVLVRKNTEADADMPCYMYYSLREESSGAGISNIVDYCTAIPMPVEGADSYEVSSQLILPTLNYLTGLVLTAYSEAERAEIFFKRAQ